MKKGIIGGIAGGIVFVGLLAGLIIALVVFVEKGDQEFVRPVSLILTDYEHKVGGLVTFSIKDLAHKEKGNVLFVTPKNSIYASIPYDADVKKSFNQYFRLELSKPLKLCSVEDLVGTWTIYFNGTYRHEPINFQVLNQTIEGETFKPIC